MHGRLKVKTTAEQQEAKRKEREKKLKLYNGATQKIFQKRGKQEFDDELLMLTGQILGQNSDFYTLWNIRKEIFTHFRGTKDSDELIKLFDDELDFLETCLRGNPKSYGTWEHRCWMLMRHPKQDWKHELFLCNKFLEYDERNFHCWDYRRFVVKQSSVPKMDELEYTTNKISSNFSNYSSWHYRSKLLPELHPDQEHPVGVKEDILLNEFELAQNAFFTDPSDQSAWFYHRWLLGRGEMPLEVYTICTTRKTGRLVAGLTRPVEVGRGYRLSLKINSEIVTCSWENPFKSKVSTVWVCDIKDKLTSYYQDTTIDVTIQHDDHHNNRNFVLMPFCDEVFSRKITKPGTLFRNELSAATSDVLVRELDSIQQLHELEPDNKWVLLTTVSLMRAIDPLKHEQETMEYIDKLIQVDPCRTNYYLDLRSKYIVENTLEQLDPECRTVELDHKQLTSIAHLSHMAFVSYLSAKSNKITSLKNFYLLQCVAEIDLRGNLIQDCEGLEKMPILEKLDLSNNSISTIEGLASLSSCSGLVCLDVINNPVCELENFQQDTKKHIPHLKLLNGQFL